MLGWGGLDPCLPSTLEACRWMVWGSRSWLLGGGLGATDGGGVPEMAMGGLGAWRVPVGPVPPDSPPVTALALLL